MSKRQRPKRAQPSLRAREAQARAAIQRRKAEEAERQEKADSLRIATTTADVDARMRRLSRERAERVAAVDRAEERRRLDHRTFLRHHGGDIARHRQGLLGDMLLNVSDPAEDILPMASLTQPRGA